MVKKNALFESSVFIFMLIDGNSTNVENRQFAECGFIFMHVSIVPNQIRH